MEYPSSMYLLDWKAPKRLRGVIKQLYEEYLEDAPEELNKRQRGTLNKAIACFVYNASYNVGLGVVDMEVTLDNHMYSKPLVYNCNRVNRKVSYTYTKKVIHWLESVGLIRLDLGRVEAWESRGGRVAPLKVKQSTVALLPSLYDLLSPIASVETQDITLSVLEMRDEDGNTLVKRLSDKQRNLIALLETYNMKAAEHTIELDGKNYFIIGKKVFNNDCWEQGGRTYLLGAKITTELLKRENRPCITINGEPTVELDFSHLHPSMIAELEGVTFDKEFDPYGFSLEGYDNKCLRKIAKIGTLCLVNARSRQEAQRALNWDIGKKLPLQEWKDEGLIPSPVSSRLMIDSVLEHNSYAMGWFGEGRGLSLQHLDSLIMDYCLDHFTQKNILIIPVHDSIVIQAKYREEGMKVLRAAYKSVLGSDNNCKIEEK